MPQDFKMSTSPVGQSQPSPGTNDVAKVTDALGESATHLKDDVKHAAAAAASQAKEVAESRLEAGRDFAAEHLGSVATALRKAGDDLRSSDSPATEYIGKAASALDHVSYYLQTRTLSHMMSDLEGFSRREPAIFLGGAFVVGLLGGRFMKSATPARAGRHGQQQGRAFGALPAYMGSSSDRSTSGDRGTLPGANRAGNAQQASPGASAQGSPDPSTQASRGSVSTGSSTSETYGSTSKPSSSRMDAQGASPEAPQGSSAPGSFGSPMHGSDRSAATAKPQTANGGPHNGESAQPGARR